MKRALSGLWQNSDFMKLWTGQTVSEFGSRITRDGLPLIAVIVLAATPEQMGLLTALAALPMLVLGLFAGVWVDRLRRRPIMIVSDIGRFLILLSIPFAALTNSLTITHIYVVVILTGILSLLFDLAYRSLLPTLIDKDELVEGNTKLATTDSLAEIGGPAIAGLLVQVIYAPFALVFDALSFLFSAGCITLIRKPEPRPQPAETRGNMKHEMVAGLRVIASHPILRTIALGMGFRSFFGNFIGTIYALYCIRVLGFSPALIGILIATGGIGALLGSLSSSWFTGRYGLGRTLTRALLFGSIVNLLMPAAGGPLWVAVGMMILGQILNDGAMAIYMINEMSLRQMVVPNHLLGRANATMGFLAEAVAPAGALIGGLFAGSMGERMTMWVAVLGILFTAVWMLVSPVRKLQAYPETT